MAHADLSIGVLSKPVRFSYWFLAAVLVLVSWLHVGGAFVGALFAYLALTRLNFLRRRGKGLSVLLCLILLAALAYGLGYVVREMVKNLPEIAEEAVPSFIQWAKTHGL